MAKWTWSKHDFSNLQKKHPQIAKYSYTLLDERGFSRGTIAYFSSMKKYVVYAPSKKWGAWDDMMIGEFSYLSDAKRKLESYWGKKMTRARKSRAGNDYGIKGKWMPFQE